MSKSAHAAADAWRAYVSVGRIQAPLLRHPIFRAWERCHLAGVNPWRMRAEVYSSVETERLLSRNLELVDAAKPYLRALSRAAGAQRHAATLVEAQAIVLDVVGDEATVHGPQSVAGPGSLLAERHAGANSAATSIVEDRYVELVGPEHFIGGFHAFTCQGVPIHGVDGEMVGSLNVTLYASEAADRMRRMLEVAGRGIEAELIVSRLRTRLRELPRGCEWTHLERLHQDLIQIHTAGRLEFELASFELTRGSDAEKLIRKTRALIERFARLARLWRILADPLAHVVDELDADQLVWDSVDLIQTEARIARVQLRTETMPCGRVRRVHDALSALLHGHSMALRWAGEMGEVDIGADERGRVRWTSRPIAGRLGSTHYDLQVLRP